MSQQPKDKKENDKQINKSGQSVHTIVADTPRGQAEYAVLSNKTGFQLRRLTPKGLSKKQRRRINKQFADNTK